jgi:hypothetical protein
MHETARQQLSNALLRMGAERELERQQVVRSVLATADPHAAGYGSALAALKTAQVFGSALLWLGWRLQPRNLAQH